VDLAFVLLSEARLPSADAIIRSYNDIDSTGEGMPISAAPEDTVSLCSSCAMERHQAINWLSGFSEIYSQTDTST
jgi:hypothetical protein